jgi:hypothetical protein
MQDMLFKGLQLQLERGLKGDSAGIGRGGPAPPAPSPTFTPVKSPQKETRDVQDSEEHTVDQQISDYLERLEQQGISSPLEIFILVKIEKGKVKQVKERVGRLWGVTNVTSTKAPSLLVTAQVHSVKVIKGLLTALREVKGVDQTVEFPLDIGEIQGSKRRSWLF